MKYKQILVKVSDLLLNIENPRYEKVKNQREAIKIMIADQEEKLYNLAEDILNNGLNPSDPVLILEQRKPNDNSPLYIVLEGNRRVCALKLLENPDLIPQSYKALQKKFISLHAQFLESPIDEISCILFENQKDAEHWIELKHTGQNAGIGTVGWDAQQKARFESKVKGKKNSALQIIDFLKNCKYFDSHLKQRLNEVNSSSLQRLLDDPDVRDVIGIKKKKGNIKSKYPPVEIIKPLKKIISDLLSKGFTVKSIYHKKDRLKYLETFEEKDLPNKAEELPRNWDIQEKYNKSTTSKQKRLQSSAPILSKRKTLIPKNTIIKIKEPRINKIYYELKRLNINDFENAVAVTFRVFIELSLDAYIEKHQNNLSINDKLSKKLHNIAKEFEKLEILNKNKLKGVYTAATMKDSIFSIDTFNAFVHNKDFHPDPTQLKKNWDNLEIFLKKLWELI